VKGNALLGYHLHFDVEGDSGLVARACGTACRVQEVDGTREEEEGEEGGREGGRRRGEREGRWRRRGYQGGRGGGREEGGEGGPGEEVQLLTLTEFHPSVRFRLGGLGRKEGGRRCGWMRQEWGRFLGDLKATALPLLSLPHLPPPPSPSLPPARPPSFPPCPRSNGEVGQVSREACFQAS
jgi:hypothetical protein